MNSFHWFMVSWFPYNTNFSLRLHYSGEAGKEGDAEAIPFEPA